MTLDKYLIAHCSPTLASLKTANMFTCRYESEAGLQAAVAAWNELFDEKGVSLLVLRESDGLALIYVCRKKRLGRDLQQPGVQEFLHEYGYDRTDVDGALCTLQQRLAEQDGFPHEIGIFLSYPLADVRGFIDNAGANSLCTGCWKVYCNECEAVKMFNRFKKCREVYSRLYASGSRDILQLTVNVG